MKLNRILLMTVLGSSFLLCRTGSAQTGTNQAAGGVSADTKVMEIVSRMTERLTQADGFSVAAEIGFDVVQDSGQKMEFGETRKFVLSRPDKLRVEEVKRSGERSSLTFDGRQLAIYFESNNIYSVADKPGTVNDVIKYYVHDLGMRLPLAEMLSTRLTDVLQAKVREAHLVDESVIDGVLCDHIALRGDDVDMQLWIEKNGSAVLQRAVITYHTPGYPQFWARFHDWNFSPDVSDADFAFVPPANGRKVAFSPYQEDLQSEDTSAAEKESL